MRYWLFVLGIFLFFSPAQADWRAQTALSLIASDLGLRPEKPAFQTEFTFLSTQGERDLVEFQMKAPSTRLTPVRLLLSGPRGFMTSAEKHPIVFVVAGFLSGQNSIHLIKAPGPFILAGFEYSQTEASLLHRPELVAELIRQTPGQIAASLAWLEQQHFANSGQIHFLGVSLGTLFAPVSLHLASRFGIQPSTTILAFGGADIGAVISQVVNGKVGSGQADQISNLVTGLLSLHDPRLHLPSLKGPFLVIRGSQDQIFPESSGRMLEDLLPEPKTLRLLPVDHIDPNKPEIVELANRQILEFLHQLFKPSVN
jgi:hypothetical protein